MVLTKFSDKRTGAQTLINVPNLDLSTIKG